MKTIVKYSLNPLARCFVPLSMKGLSGNLTSEVFPVINYDNTELLKYSDRGFMGVRNKPESVSKLYGTMKEGKEVLSDVHQIVTEESFVTTKSMLSTDRETPRDTAQESIAKKLTGDEICKVRLTDRIDTGDASLMALDILLPRRNTLRKSCKVLGKPGIRMKLLFSLPNLLETNWIFRLITKSAVNLYMAMMFSSIFGFEPMTEKNKITYPNNTEKVVKDVGEDQNICPCPPMFGWIVPLNFLGNPLKLRSACSKKFAHISYDDENEEDLKSSKYFPVDGNLFSDEKDEVTTLEQYSSELEAIIKDVCDSVDNTLATSDGEGSERASQTNVLKSNKKRPVWETVTKNCSDLEIVDDGAHPLLEEVCCEEPESKTLLETQELLEKALSHERYASSHQSVCIPPCTVWCNSVPPPAKDTYKRFIKKLHSESVQSNVTDNKKAFRKTLFKRCFSADDTPKSSDFDRVPLLSPTSSESRERLLLLRKDPVAFIKSSNRTAFEDGNWRAKSVSEKFSTKDYSKESSDLSPFYGVDSLWQPLPDCVPASDQAQKHAHKRVRDMRRQKSVC